MALAQVKRPPANPSTTTKGNQTRQLAQAEPIKVLPTKSKRWALVIGVDKYRDGQISALTGSVNDAHRLAEALVSYAGFPADQVILLATDQPEERQPTRINILTLLSNLGSLVPKDGLLLVSFAGHGTERAGQAYLIPSDARLSDDVSLLEESAVSVSRVHDRIKATGVGQILLLLDACRNDPGGRADAPNPLSAAYTRGFSFDVRNREVQAFATLYATAVGQRAYEYTEKRQGYFTWAVVEGLKGGAANSSGEVTLSALVKYVQEVVPKRIAIDLGSGKQQRPFANIEGYRADDLVIAVTAPNRSNLGTNASVLDPAAVELSYWDSIKNSNDVADFESYLARYPNGQFSELAKRRAVAARGTGVSALPSPDSLVETYIRNLGWSSAGGKITSLTMKGTVEVVSMGQTYNGAAESYSKFHKNVSLLNIPKLGKSADGFDGVISWHKDERGARAGNEWQHEFTKRNLALTYLSDLATFKAIYPKSSVLGKETVGNRETYVVQVEPKGTNPEKVYFDIETGLIVRWDVLFQSGDAQKGVGTPMQLYVDEYADVLGIKIGSTYRQVGSGVTFTIKYYDIKYNQPINDNLFTKPAK